MKTECNTRQLEFQGVGRRGVVGKFDGGNITSDSGGLLLREVDERLGISKRFAECFTDYRDEKSIEHEVEALVRQRIYGIALGYEERKTLRVQSGEIRGIGGKRWQGRAP